MILLNLLRGVDWDLQSRQSFLLLLLMLLVVTFGHWAAPD